MGCTECWRNETVSCCEVFDARTAVVPDDLCCRCAAHTKPLYPTSVKVFGRKSVCRHPYRGNAQARDVVQNNGLVMEKAFDNR